MGVTPLLPRVAAPVRQFGLDPAQFDVEPLPLTPQLLPPRQEGAAGSARPPSPAAKQ